MSKHRTKSGWGRTELQLSWHMLYEKTLIISWLDYRMAAEFSERVDSGKRGFTFKYEGEEIPLQAGPYNFEDELFSMPGTERIFVWLHNSSVESPVWEDIADFDLWMLRRVLSVIIAQRRSCEELQMPIAERCMQNDNKDVGYIHFENCHAVVAGTREPAAIAFYLLDMNMCLMFQPEKSDEDRKWNIILWDETTKPYNVGSAKYEFLLDGFEEKYSEYPDAVNKVGASEWLTVHNVSIGEWLNEMYALLRQPPAREQASDENADETATASAGDTEDYRKLKAIFYASQTPEFFEQLISSLPDAYRKRVLLELDNGLKKARAIITPGDVVLRDTGGFHIVVANDGEKLETLTRKRGKFATDSFPLEKAFPTGCKFEEWDEMADAMEMYI